MANFIRSDLEFILAQIRIAEAHSAGEYLYDPDGPGPLEGLVPSYVLSLGLRTVDGTFNNLIDGRETWGAADQPFPELLDPVFRTAEPSPFGPPGPATTYDPSSDPSSLVVDSSLRTISNLIVDMSLANPAAVYKALQNGGIVEATLENVALVQAIHNVFQPFAAAAYQASVAAATAHAAFLAAAAAFDADPTPENQLALDAAILADAAAAAASSTADADATAARAVRDAQLPAFGIEMAGDSLSIPNFAPDVGLSAPFNSWFTLFGQFFDHGLDLVNKGGSGTVLIPLQPDDPLYVEGSPTNFMVLTRATVSPGEDDEFGTADDVRPVNTTTPFVDQNQTYTSHPSHQVFLRQYVLTPDGPVATGKLIEGGGASPGGMATWGEVKAQAALLGIQLTDADVGKVPLLRTDPYGNFIRDPLTGGVQVVTGLGLDGIPNTSDDLTVSGTPSTDPLSAGLINLTTVGAIRTNHAFLADIAHTAVPKTLEDGDIEIGLANPGNSPDVYDNELLDAHFMAGDGRVNENIGLTAVHHVFHSEHNRLVEFTKNLLVSDAVTMLGGGASQAEAVAFLNEWLALDVTEVPVGAAEIEALVWDGNRLFQAAKFGTEMQYQHLVFEDFARKIQPNIDFFVVPDGYHADINPAIVAEFAHVVYRFGHSMLTETIDRLDPSFNEDHIGLIEAFLNPVAFDDNHAISDDVAAGAIVRGMTRQVGNEIDEFVTGALRNNLLGLPLDLPTINLARGRDTGVPSLNAARREFYAASNQAPELKPYESWVEFAGNLKTEASVINFIAAYGTHDLITAETTIEGKRAAAMAIIFGTPQPFVGDPSTTDDDRMILPPDDALDFLGGTGAWASDPSTGVTTTGLDVIDLWIGGLAEKIMPFGGMLGSTFNFVFEVQLEKLQDGDRFYYLQRLDGLHFLGEMENNTFAKVISANTDAQHLPNDVFSTPGLILEVDQSQQFNPELGGADPVGGGILTPLVVRNNPATAGPDTNYLRYTGADHVLLGGTNPGNAFNPSGNDILIGSEGDDTLHGDAGNDRMEGGYGNDAFIGGDGDDIVTDIGGDDLIRVGPGNDAVNAGQGTDLVIGDEGHDFIVLGADLLDETFAGVGNDYVLGSKTTEQSMGGEGDDWIEIGAWTGAVGDNFDDQFAADSVKGHDVFSGDGGFDEFIGEGGDDIWNGTLGRGKFDGMSGFDWSTYKDIPFAIDADLTRLHFDALPLPPAHAALDEYSFVEGVSGTAFGDQILGSDVTDLADPIQGGARGSVLTAEGIALIAGLQEVLGAGVDSFGAGNILLGGAGSDEITGRGGNDIIDGDKWLNVRVGVFENEGPDGGIGTQIDTADSLSELVTEIFDGTYKPGQLRIVREILAAPALSNEIDVAIFRDVRASYTITENDDGTFTVAHTGGTQIDGTDTLRNMEIARFTDVDIVLNRAATGAAVLSDSTPTEGFVLTVDTSTIADLDGLGPFSFQWQSSADGLAWSEIAGATSATLVPQDLAGMTPGAQAGLQLRAVVSFTDGRGSEETLISDPTGPVGLNWQGPPAATIFTGNAGDDIAAGGNAGDVLNGNDGTDLLNGNGGDDTVNGGAGNDTLNGGTGIDTLDGGDGDDALNGGTGNDTLLGGNGNDTVASSGGNDTVLTGDGDDVVNYGLHGVDTVDGGLGNDTLNVTGTAGNNSLALVFGGALITSLQGGSVEGIEVINADLGAGTDALNYGATSQLNSVTVNLAAGTASGLASFSGVENVIGGDGDDSLTGDDGVNTLNGDLGNDTLNGAGGTDTLNGAGGNDTIVATVGDGDDTINGGAGSDTYDLSGTTAGATIVVNVGTTPLTTTASSGDIGTDTLTGVENYVGSQGNDTITVNGGANTIDGQAGNDIISSGGGADVVTGGSGNDLMDGGAGVDRFVFGAGFGNDAIVGFDSNPAGGQDLIDLTALGITDFAAEVTITVIPADVATNPSADTLVTIGTDTIFLDGVTGVEQTDFVL